MRKRACGAILIGIALFFAGATPVGAHPMDGDGDWWDNHVLKLGGSVTQGNMVTFWEAALSAQYANDGHINGTFQTADDWLTRQFQSDHGITVDGIVGVQTWNTARFFHTVNGGPYQGGTLWTWSGGPWTFPMWQIPAFDTWLFQSMGCEGTWYNTNHPGITNPPLC